MKTEAIEVITLEGAPTARGLAHGEMLRARIRELLDRWDEALQRVYRLSRARYIERFYVETKFEDALKRHAPTVLDEVAAIAKGAAVDYRTLLAWQHINEEFWLAPPQPDEAIGEACSTMAIGPVEGCPALIGQNLDLDQYLDGYQILLRYPCDNSDGRILAPSVPGMISLNGMNSHGFAVCDNALTKLRADISGVPIFAIYRLLLESRSLADAVALMERLPHASGLNWVMGDCLGVAMYERSATHAVKYGPDGAFQTVYHTNHPLRNCDVVGPVGHKPGRSTYLRYAALHERISLRANPIDIPAIKAILRGRDDPDYPVSRAGGKNEEDEAIGFTLASCIFELDPAQPRLHLAAGPPHLHDFAVFAA